MADDLPYMISVGHVSAILERIREAGTPPKFNHEFLTSSLGFTSSADRGIIKVLKQAGFLGNDGTPTPRYNEFRSSVTGGTALAQGLREGWAPIFLADQRVYQKNPTQLTEIFKTVTGKGEAVAVKMATTFRALATHANWSVEPPPAPASASAPLEDAKPEDVGVARGLAPANGIAEDHGNINLHHDIHVHLPPTSDVTVYRAIFRALREELL